MAPPTDRRPDVGSGHAASLHVPGDTVLHRMRPQCKIVAAVAFVFVVVATPREQVWAYAAYATALAALVLVARLRPGLVLRRMTVEVPFVAFALFLPFVAGGEQLGSGWYALSVDGLWAAWNILAKGTIGVTTSVVLTATTSLPDLVRGLERLRVPRAFTSIVSFMIRYASVIAGEMHRMKVARESRGHDPRWLWQIRAIAHSAGTLFVRSYERGERVHLAMLSRAYTGALPVLGGERATRREWLTASALPLVALVVATGAWTVHPT